MGKSIKFKEDVYLDSSSIARDKKTLDEHFDTNVYQLQWATILPDGTDLNDITQTGTYRSRGTTQTVTMKNVPASQTSGFQLLVFRTASMNYYDNSVPECITQEIKRDSRIFTRYTWDYGETWSDWAVHCGYRIGDIYITSTSDDPSSELGGTWELIDKEFYNFQTTFSDAADIANYVTATEERVEITELVVRRISHSVNIRIAFTTLVELSDSSTQIMEINPSALGLTGFSYTQHGIIVGSDGGNAVLNLSIYDDGRISCQDVIVRGSSTALLPIDSSPRLFYKQDCWYKNMINEFCNRFYWKRIA